MTRQLALLTVFILVFGGLWFPAAAQEEITPATPAIIDGLRRDAARMNAMRIGDPVEKRWWLEDLAGYVAKAEELEEYAFFLNRQAAADDSRATRLQAALNAGN